MGQPSEDVKGPAIGLISLGALGVLSALFTLLGTLLGFGNEWKEELERTGHDLGEFTRFLVGGNLAMTLILGLVGIAGSAFIAYAGLQMRKLQDHTLCMIASVFAMLPCITPSCCCVVGLPIGIWALIVLNRADVRSAFGATST